MFEQFAALVRRAVLLERDAWAELRDNGAYTALAAALAAVAVVLGGIGAFLWGEINFQSTPDGWFVDTVILGTVFSILLLLAWAAVIYVMMVQVFRVTVAPDALFRVFAVALLPLALGLLVFIPELNFWIGLSSIIVTFCLITYALETAFAMSQMRAFLATMAGFTVFAIVLALLITVDNGFVNGVFTLEFAEDWLTHDFTSSFSIEGLQ